MVMEKNMWEKVGEVFTYGPDPKRCSTNLSHLGWFFMYDIFKSIGVLNYFLKSRHLTKKKKYTILQYYLI